MPTHSHIHIGMYTHVCAHKHVHAHRHTCAQSLFYGPSPSPIPSTLGVAGGSLCFSGYNIELVLYCLLVTTTLSPWVLTPDASDGTWHCLAPAVMQVRGHLHHTAVRPVGAVLGAAAGPPLLPGQGSSEIACQYLASPR